MGLAPGETRIVELTDMLADRVYAVGRDYGERVLQTRSRDGTNITTSPLLSDLGLRRFRDEARKTVPVETYDKIVSMINEILYYRRIYPKPSET